MSPVLRVPVPLEVHEVRAVDGYPIALRRHGNPDGPRLVFGHGNGFAADAYWPFWSRFTEDFDVFVHDVRNHGWNPVGDPDAQTIPAVAADLDRVSREIDRRFGARPRAGVFHSLTAMAALHAATSHEYAALVLFDPPMLLPGRAMVELERLGAGMAAATRRRRWRFAQPSDYAQLLAEKPAFARLDPSRLDLFARSTLRRADDGKGYELCCPPEHEARLWDALYPFARKVDFGAMACPLKVIGSDPTVPNSFLPSVRMPEILLIEYDFVPETTHLLQLEEPDLCADFTLQYLAEQAFPTP